MIQIIVLKGGKKPSLDLFQRVTRNESHVRLYGRYDDRAVR